MWGKRRRETEPENSPAAEVQKFFASMAPAAEAQPQAGAEAQSAPDAQPLPAPAPQANGAAAQPLAATENAAPAPEQVPRPVRANPVSTAFGDMVALLAKSPAHKHFSLADLEWLLLPPVALGQIALADATLQNGQTALIGFALWARVSEEVDARLTNEPRYPVRLHPNEWRSGDILWIIDAVGEQKAVQQCIEELRKTVLQGKQVKILSADGAKLKAVSIQRGMAEVNESTGAAK